MAKDPYLDYESSLEDLTFNSKPIINMLTMMAGRNRDIADRLVELIETRISKVAGIKIRGLSHLSPYIVVSLNSLCLCVVYMHVLVLAIMSLVTLKKKRKKDTVSKMVPTHFTCYCAFVKSWGPFVGTAGIQATNDLLDGFYDEKFGW